MVKSPNGQVVETLGVHDESSFLNNPNPNRRYKIGDVRPPTLEEVMLDSEYFDELKKSNELLMNYLTPQKLLEMTDLVTQDPLYVDSPERCFKLPILACETLTLNIKGISDIILGKSAEASISSAAGQKFPILDKLVSYFIAPDPRSKPDSKRLNPTLGGYVNRILSFWLIKRPEEFLAYIVKKRDLIQSLFNHLYLTRCVTDLLVRICTIPEV